MQVLNVMVLLAVALLAALTHVDATEVQGQLKGETQHAEQVAVEAKAGQSLRAGLLGSLSQIDSASTEGNCNCSTTHNGKTYYYEGGYQKCSCYQGCTCTNCFPPFGTPFVFYTLSYYPGINLMRSAAGAIARGTCNCKTGGICPRSG
jgi:hypothetical protein